MGWRTDGGCVLGASDPEVSDSVLLVSILSGFLFLPDSLRSRTPGLVFLAVALGGLGITPLGGRGTSGGAAAGGGAGVGGRALDGGGYIGGGSGLSFI